MRNSFARSITCAFVAVLMGSAVQAQDVRITPEMDEARFNIDGTDLTIERIQDQDHRLEGEFTKTSRACPPFCVHPMKAADGVETVGEIEVIRFIEEHVQAGTGLLIDSRVPSWFAKGSIPGAINIPFTTLEPSNPYRNDILRALGASGEDGALDYSNAVELLMFCNGPWCDQSPRAINNIIAAGYPAEKISYYRGGMQLWLLLGLSTTGGAS